MLHKIKLLQLDVEQKLTFAGHTKIWLYNKMLHKVLNFSLLANGIGTTIVRSWFTQKLYRFLINYYYLYILEFLNSKKVISAEFCISEKLFNSLLFLLWSCVFTVHVMVFHILLNHSNNFVILYWSRLIIA